MKTGFSKCVLASAVALAFAGQSAVAQEANNTPSAGDDTEIIVVSGTPGGAGIRKIDASFAVTNIDASDIENWPQNPPQTCSKPFRVSG